MNDSIVIDVLQYDKELAELLEIYIKSFKEYFRDNELQSKAQQFEQAIHHAIESSEVCETYVAKSKNTIIGFSCIIQTKPQHWYLGPFAVLPEYRRQGIGKILIKHALEFACHYGGGTVTLVTRWYNERAIRFYQGLNFRIDSEYDYKGQKILKMILKI
ncbi:MAG: GNAT family N-acetyltransferase [Promethearchaeota archaeon]